MSIHFYDSATPENIPSGVYACAYVNGFAWPESEIARMSHILRITVQAEADWARYAAIIDVENGAASPADVPAFLRERRSLFGETGIAYVNRANYQDVKALVDAAGLDCLYWVATLDGTMDVPGAWAVQYQGGVNARFDLSILHGVNRFHRV
jgi:hypothetical protein